MSFHSKASVCCFYCSKVFRRDKLGDHTKSKHPRCPVKEKLQKGVQDISHFVMQQPQPVTPTVSQVESDADIQVSELSLDEHFESENVESGSINSEQNRDAAEFLQHSDRDSNSNIVERNIVQVSNDPGANLNQIVKPEFVRNILRLGPCQPGLHSEFNFPQTNGRSFRKEWYNPTMQNGVKRYREWLIYSPQKDSAFCFSC